MINLSNKLLISNPTTDDDTMFNRALVYVAKHKVNESAFGFIINKDSGTNHSELFRGLGANAEKIPEVQKDMFVQSGGPVDNLQIFLLIQEKNSNEIKVLSETKVNEKRIADIIANKNTFNYKFFQGCATWGAGQLELEFERDLWIVTDYPPEIIFEETEENKIDFVAQSLGINLKMFALPLKADRN